MVEDSPENGKQQSNFQVSAWAIERGENRCFQGARKGNVEKIIKTSEKLNRQFPRIQEAMIAEAEAAELTNLEYQDDMVIVPFHIAGGKLYLFAAREQAKLAGFSLQFTAEEYTDAVDSWSVDTLYAINPEVYYDLSKFTDDDSSSKIVETLKGTGNLNADAEKFIFGSDADAHVELMREARTSFATVQMKKQSYLEQTEPNFVEFIDDRLAEPDDDPNPNATRASLLMGAANMAIAVHKSTELVDE